MGKLETAEFHSASEAEKRPVRQAQGRPQALNSVDHNLRLKADHNPRLGRWIVIQREPF